MVVYTDGLVALLFGLLCVMSILPIHASNYFMDKGNCKCIPYSKNCSMEVVDISMRSSFYARTCWYGARLCCDKSTPSRTRNGNHMDYLRGYVFSVNNLKDKNNRHHASVGNKTTDEYGKSKQKVKINWTDKERQLPKTPGIRKKIPNAVPLTTDSNLKIKSAEEIKQLRLGLLHRPTDFKYNGIMTLNIPGGDRMNFEDGTKSFSSGNKPIENKSADEDGKLIIRNNTNKGNTSDEYGTENELFVNVSAFVGKHSGLTASAVPKVIHSIFITVTTVPSKTKFTLLSVEFPTAKSSYFSGIDLVVKTYNEGTWISKMSKSSSGFVPNSFESVSYGFTTTVVPRLSVNGGGESNITKKVLSRLFQSQFTSHSLVTIPISKHSKVSEMSDTKTINLTTKSSFTANEIPNVVVVPELINSSAHLVSSTSLSSDISNAYISLGTTVSHVYTLITKGFSYVQVSSLLHVKTTPTTVVYNASKSQSKVLSYTLDLTPPLMQEIPSFTKESHVFTSVFKMLTSIENFKFPLSPNILSPHFTTASDILSLTPLLRTTTLSITALSPAFPLVSDVFSYTKNMTSQVSVEISLITPVSGDILASDIHLYNENLTSLITLEATLNTAVSTVFTTAPKVISHSHKSTQPAVLKTAFITTFSPVFEIASWSLLTQTSRLESRVFTANFLAFTTVTEVFLYPQDFILPVSPKSSPIKESITLTLSTRGTNTQTRPLISINMETTSLQVNPDTVFAYLAEDTSNVVSPNREKHWHSYDAYEILRSLFPTSVKHFTNSNYEDLDYGSRSKTSTTPPDPISRTVTKSDYQTHIPEYYSHKNGFPQVLHTSEITHSSEKYSGYTNLNKKQVTHIKHYIRASKVLKSYIQKNYQSAIFDSQPALSVKRDSLNTNDLYSHLTLSVKRSLFPKVTETGKYTFKNTATLLAAHEIHDSSNAVLVGARNRDLNPSKSLVINFVSTRKIPKLQAWKSMNLGNLGKVTEKSNNQDSPALYIKPSSASEKEFQKFLQSMLEKRLNKSKTDTDEGSGVWSWLFG